MIRIALPVLLVVLLRLAATPVAAQDPPGQEVDERRPLRADGWLHVKVSNHSLQIEAWEREEVHVVGRIDPDLQRFELTGDEGSLVARVVRTDPWQAPDPLPLGVRVPRGSRLSVVTGTMDVWGGRGRLEVSTRSGPIRLRVEGPVDHLRIESLGGSVDFVGELSGSARGGVESHVGPVTLEPLH